MSDSMIERIGWKPRFTDPRVASTRIRCLNPMTELQSRGYPIEIFDRSRAGEYAAVVYSKLYDDVAYEEAISLQKNGTRIVFDLCDNHFYNPNGLASLRKAGAQLRRIMAMADELVASTAAMADVMRSETAASTNVTIIEDAVENEIHGVETTAWDRWRAKREFAQFQKWLGEGSRSGRTPLVWFGIHGGPNAEYGMLDLLKLRPLLEDLNKTFPLNLTVISNSQEKYRRAVRPWSIPTFYLRWHPETLFAALRSHAIAVIPITDNPFTRCKSNNRVALSLNMGLAVVADSIPSYQDFSACCYLGDWQSGLRNYLSDPQLRRRHIEQGQTIVDREWTIARLADKWREFFDMLLAKRTNHAHSLRCQEIAAQGL